jgi:hypothetical protein
MANSFNKDYNTASKLSIRVASEQQRITTTTIFCPSIFPFMDMTLRTKILEFFLTEKIQK